MTNTQIRTIIVIVTLKVLSVYIRLGKSFTAARSKERPLVLGVAKWPFIIGRCAAGRPQPAAGLQIFSQAWFIEYTNTSALIRSKLLFYANS